MRRLIVVASSIAIMLLFGMTGCRDFTAASADRARPLTSAALPSLDFNAAPVHLFRYSKKHDLTIEGSKLVLDGRVLREVTRDQALALYRSMRSRDDSVEAIFSRIAGNHVMRRGSKKRPSWATPANRGAQRPHPRPPMPAGKPPELSHATSLGTFAPFRADRAFAVSRSAIDLPFRSMVRRNALVAGRDLFTRLKSAASPFYSYCATSYETMVQCYYFDQDFVDLEAYYRDLKAEMEDEFAGWLSTDPALDAFNSFMSALADGTADVWEWLWDNYGDATQALDEVKVYELEATYTQLNVMAWEGTQLGVWTFNGSADWYIDCSDEWYWDNYPDICGDYWEE